MIPQHVQHAGFDAGFFIFLQDRPALSDIDMEQRTKQDRIRNLAYAGRRFSVAVDYYIMGSIFTRLDLQGKS